MLLPMLVVLTASQARGPLIDLQTIASAPDADASNLLCKAPGPNASRAQPAHDAMTSVAKNFFDGDLAVAASKSNTSDGDKHADAVKYDIEFDPFCGRCKRASQSLQRQCDAGPQTFAPAVAPPRSWKKTASATASAQPGATAVNRSASPLLSAPFWAGCAGGLLMRDLDDHEEGDIDSLAKLDARRAGPQMPLREKSPLFSCLAPTPGSLDLAGTGPANIDLADDILADDILAGEILDDPDFGASVLDLLAGFPPSNYPFP